MPLTKEQISQLKEQLRSQVANLPEDKKAEALKQIDEMSAEALELMISQQQSQAPPKGQKTIYRMIIDKEVDSIQVGENPNAIAVLEINPISKGHTIIIPKSPIKDPKKLPKSLFSLAQSLTDKIISNLKAKSTKAETEIKFGEAILNLIPIYDKPLSLSSPRSKAPPEKLQEIKKALEVIKISKAPEKIKIEKPIPKKPLKLKRRIP
jgi:hypothetical protein